MRKAFQPSRQAMIQGALGVGLIQLLLVAPLFSADLSVKAFVDRTVVPLGGNFTLSVELSGGDADRAPAPEHPDLLSFADYLGSGTSTSVQIVNGRMSQTRTLNFYFRATSLGTFEIGAITVLLDGTEHASKPFQIQIVQSGGRSPRSRQQPSRTDGITDDDLFVKAEVSEPEAFVNEAVIVTYRIYTRVDVSQYEISSLPDHQGFWVEDLLGNPASPQTESETINGVRFLVATIKKEALFATSAGEKTIEPLEIDCVIRLNPTRRSLFDDFFSDPFGRTVRYRLKSEPVRIKVLPLPEEGKPADFSGAVGSFSLQREVNNTTLPVNDVASIKLTVTGTGNIRTLPSPKIEVSPGLETYDPEVSESVRADGDGILGTRTYEWVVVPRVPGQQTINPIRLSYFDPQTREYRVALADKINFDVKPTSDLAPTASTSPATKEQVRFIAEDIRFIKLSPGSLRSVNSPLFENPNFWGILLVPLAGVGLAAAYSRHLGRLEADYAYARSRKAAKTARQHLSRARELLDAAKGQQDFYAECEKALSGFAADKLNVARAGIMIEDLRDLFSLKGAAGGVVEDYLDCLRVCEQKRFSPALGSREENEAFLNRAERAVRQLEEAIPK